jgi:hypothetical protein
MVAPERSVDLDGVSSDAVKIVYKMISILQEARQAGATTQGDSLLVASFGHQVSISGVKTLGLPFSTWQWRIYIQLLDEGIVWSLFILSSG